MQPQKVIRGIHWLSKSIWLCGPYQTVEHFTKKWCKGKNVPGNSLHVQSCKSRSSVRCDLTDSFMCPRGLKQGDICSPVLFSMFIDELANKIMERSRHGIQLTPDLVQIFILEWRYLGLIYCVWFAKPVEHFVGNSRTTWPRCQPRQVKYHCL